MCCACFFPSLLLIVYHFVFRISVWFLGPSLVSDQFSIRGSNSSRRVRQIRYHSVTQLRDPSVQLGTHRRTATNLFSWLYCYIVTMLQLTAHTSRLQTHVEWLTHTHTHTHMASRAIVVRVGSTRVSSLPDMETNYTVVVVQVDVMSEKRYWCIVRLHAATNVIH